MLPECSVPNLIASESPSFLVVEDDPRTSQSLTRVVSDHGNVAMERTMSGTERLLASSKTWSAFFIDLDLPDGSGLDVLSRMRAALPTIPGLVLTGSISSDAINFAFDMRAECVVKPIVTSRIERFIESALSQTAKLRHTVSEWEKRYHLSHAESDILFRATRGEGRKTMALARGSSPLTIKTQAVTLLQKTSDDSVHGAVMRLLRETIEGSYS